MSNLSTLPTTPSGPIAPTSGFRLLLADNFGGTSLDSNIWAPTREYPGAASLTSGYNDYEKEAFDSSNVSVSGNNCILNCIPQTVSPPNPPSGWPTTCNYTSGVICTSNANHPFMFSPTYAGTIYIESKIKFPGSTTGSAGSIFPAFWLLGCRQYGATTNWGTYTREIDIIEVGTGANGSSYVGQPTAIDTVQIAPSGGYGTGAPTNLQEKQKVTVDLSQAFHVFTTQINSNGSIQVWMDGTSLWTMNAYTATDWMGIILNYALVANPGAGFTGDQMLINYVMAWQDAGVSVGSGVLGGGIAANTIA